MLSLQAQKIAVCKNTYHLAQTHCSDSDPTTHCLLPLNTICFVEKLQILIFYNSLIDLAVIEAKALPTDQPSSTVLSLFSGYLNCEILDKINHS